VEFDPYGGYEGREELVEVEVVEVEVVVLVVVEVVVGVDVAHSSAGWACENEVHK
jgi:hypothetical protein